MTAVLDPGQVAAQVTLFLRLHNDGLVINQIFWGLWLFPIGVLVMRSTFIPRWRWSGSSARTARAAA